MNILLSVGAYDPIPSRGLMADAPSEPNRLPDKFLIKNAVSSQEAVNAIEMIVGLRPDLDAVDENDRPLVRWELVKPKAWIPDRVLVWNLAD